MSNPSATHVGPEPGATAPGELTDQITKMGLALGLAAVGVTTAEVLEPAATVIPLRKAAGLNGSMNFTYRNPQRSTDPLRAMPSARSIVAAALSYGSLQEPAKPAGTVGRAARYVWDDHYRHLGQVLATLADVLAGAGWKAQVHLDNNNLVDRNVAQRAGLGYYGKNSLLLLPGQGSWFVLGSILTDAPLEESNPVLDDACGPCNACMEGCPTQAIVAPGVVDARRCLAWLVQGPGPIPVEFRSKVGDRLYGCDECQLVCPPNRGQQSKQSEPGSEKAWVDINWALGADDEELMAELGHWYIAQRDPNVIRRTALVILGNTGDGAGPETREMLVKYLASDSDLLRSHAAWAALELGCADLVEGSADLARG